MCEFLAHVECGAAPFAWNPNAVCDGLLATERVQWLMSNSGLSQVDALQKVMLDFPIAFRHQPVPMDAAVLTPPMAQQQCPEHMLVNAIDAIITLASSGALELAVGQYEASAVVEVGRKTASVLAAPAHSTAQWGRRAESVCDLARRCIGLAAAVEKDYDDGSRLEFDHEELDWDWEFGVVVADLIGLGLAAMVNLFESRQRDEECDAIAFNLLEELGRELDCLAAHLFGGLLRAGTNNECRGDSCHQRLCLALQNICSWSLAAVCNGVGFHRFSANHLWEWACSDPLWALVLAKGVLLSNPTDDVQTKCPTNMADLQQLIFSAVIGLASPDVAFAAEVAGEIALEQNDEYNTIPHRNMWLTIHRAHLAMALVECKILDVLIDSSKAFTAGDKLLEFLVALLQPELVGDPKWVSSCIEGVSQLAEARRSTSALQKQLQYYAEHVWIHLANASRGAMFPTKFMAECADLAYFAPPSEPLGNAFLDNSLMELPNMGEGLSDPSLLAALCVFCANVGLTLNGQSGILYSAMSNLSSDRRDVVAARLQNWRGPTDVARLSQWAMLVNSCLPSPGVPRHLESQSFTALSETAPRRCGPLQWLLQDVPAEFCCSIDGQVMMDPVQTPHGYICDRQAISEALLNSNGQCPLSNLPLSISECVRLPKLRRQVLQWVRKARPQPQKEAVIRRSIA